MIVFDMPTDITEKDLTQWTIEMLQNRPCKVLVCGGRKFDDEKFLYDILDAMHAEFKFTEIIHGGAFGADKLAGKWALERGIKETVFKPNYSKYAPRIAPLRRNTVMAQQKPDLVVAFPGGSGTADMVKKSYQHKLNVIVLDEAPRGLLRKLIRKGKRNATKTS